MSPSTMRRLACTSGCLALVLATSYCSDRAPTAPPNEIRFSGVAPGTVALQTISRGIALALRDSATRAGVFAAWRASAYTDHKLVLQVFCATPEGHLLLASLAAQLHVTELEAGELLRTISPLDFYVPFREHRTTWRGGSDVVVAATTDRHRSPSLTGFDSEGRPVLLRRSDGVPAMPLILLHPAEPKSHRVDPQSDLPGIAIQDEDDGEVSGVVTTFLPNGDSVVRELADILPGRRGDGMRGVVEIDDGMAAPTHLEECGDSCGGGGSWTPTDTTYIHAFFINYEDDSEWGNHEVEFWAWLHYNQIYGGDPNAFAKYRRDGIQNCYPYGADCVYTQTNEPGVPLFIGPRLRFTQDYMSLELKDVQTFNYTTDRGQNIWYVNQGWKPFCAGGCVYNPTPATYRGGAEVKYTRHTGP